MANLWRTQRPRFPQYISDGKGRDYYIKFNTDEQLNMNFADIISSTILLMYSVIYLQQISLAHFNCIRF